MAQIHHPTLRVNSIVPESAVEIWVEQGWLEGFHPDTDPDDDREIPAVTADPVPPRSGRGSGLDVWRPYAESLGLVVPDDATRDDVIAAVDSHLTEQKD